MAERKTLRIGLIGFGSMGRTHTWAVRNLPFFYGALPFAAVTAGVCTTTQEKSDRVASEFGIPVATVREDDLIGDPDIDVIDVCTPNNCHYATVKKALAAGKHVLCEKPLSLHSDECREMIRTAEETGKILMVGQVCRLTPGFLKAKQLIDEGVLGEIYFVESEYAHDYTEIGGWRKDPALMRHPVTGGGCHPVDLLRWLTGSDPQEVFSYSTHRALPDWPCDDSTIAVLKFSEGLMGKILVSTGCKRAYTMRTVIYGTKGTLITDNTSPQISLYTSTFGELDSFMGKRMEEIEHRIPVRVDNHNFGDEIAEFCRCIETGSQPKISAEEGARAVAVCEAIIRSSATGNPEKVRY